MAAEVPGIDVIVGGHSHTLLAQPLFVSHSPSGDPHSVNGTPIVQDFQWAGTLGRLDLTLHRSADGKWAVENEGVKPDIEVENTPADLNHGKDAQLELVCACDISFTERV